MIGKQHRMIGGTGDDRHKIGRIRRKSIGRQLVSQRLCGLRMMEQRGECDVQILTPPVIQKQPVVETARDVIDVVEAVKHQADKYFHGMFNVVTHEGYVALAEKLCSLAPVRGEHKKAFFANSGAEADENAVKIAKAYTGRPNIIVFSGAFHGRTLLTMSMTSKKAYAVGMGPFPDGIYRDMMTRYDCIGDVRGLGGMVGIEFVTDQKSKMPDAALTAAVIQECVRHGLMVEGAGTYSNVIRFLAPLVMTDAQLEAGLDIFENAVKTCSAK